MDLSSLVLAPVRVPLRIGRALDDLAVLAERASRDPDPVEQARERLDLLLIELSALIARAGEIVDGGAELTRTAKETNSIMRELLAVSGALLPATVALDGTGRDIVDGGAELTAVARRLHVDTRELIDGGSRLTAVSEELEDDLSVFRGAMPRLMKGLDTVEELEDAVETVADTVQPLQGAAERVGRVTQRFSRD
jgi:hypothetical protein